MKERRESIDILKEILELCDAPRRKTEIVYQCNLNFKVLKRYLHICFTKGFLEMVGIKYRTTTIGRGFLDKLVPVVEQLQISVQ